MDAHERVTSDLKLRVMDAVEEKGFIPDDFVESETKWFYNELGIDDSYFSTETADA